MKLHVVSFDVPSPPNYGGVIDVYYKIKSFKAAGIGIKLHCFTYGRTPAPELLELCESVNYYKRKIYRHDVFGDFPYIVNSRRDPELLANLLKDNDPIFFEGTHCCAYLDHPELEKRMKIVRMHNIEHQYYKNLAKIEKHPFKKYFFNSEAQRLKRFDTVLAHAQLIAAISPEDERLLRLKFKDVAYLPVFHQNKVIRPFAPFEKEFALYHGNLSVGENHEAALYLIDKVFSGLNYPLVIAGNSPKRELKEAVAKYPNISLVPNLTTEGINELIRHAQINVMPTFQGTGMKLKLINVLFGGGHCLVNSKMVRGTGLEPLCTLADSPIAMKEAIKYLLKQAFTEEEWLYRKEYLELHFNNDKNATLFKNTILPTHKGQSPIFNLKSTRRKQAH